MKPFNLTMIAALLLLAMPLPVNAGAATPVVKLGPVCKKAMQALRENAKGGPEERLVAWRRIAKICRGTGAYEVEVAQLLTNLGRYPEAEAELGRVMGKGSAYEPRLRFVKGVMLLRQGELADAEKLAQQTIELFPGWGGGYTQLGLVHRLQQDDSGATKFFEQSSALLGEEEPGIRLLNLLGLVAAYHAEGRYLDSAMSMQLALKLDGNALLDAPAVATAIVSLVEIDRPELAQGLLMQHVAVMPQHATDPDFLKLQALIDARRAQAANSAGGGAAEGNRAAAKAPE